MKARDGRGCTIGSSICQSTVVILNTSIVAIFEQNEWIYYGVLGSFKTVEENNSLLKWRLVALH